LLAALELLQRDGVRADGLRFTSQSTQELIDGLVLRLEQGELTIPPHSALLSELKYYRFELTTMLALGAIFQLPVVMLVLGRVGLLGSATLRAKRRYAIVALAALAAGLPGTDPVTTLLELVPLLALYELSIVMLRMSERRRASVPE